MGQIECCTDDDNIYRYTPMKPSLCYNYLLNPLHLYDTPLLNPLHLYDPPLLNPLILCYYLLNPPSSIYSVMRFCPGGELFDYIDVHGPLGDERARSMFRQLLCGLTHLQELGIAHRYVCVYMCICVYMYMCMYVCFAV
jgi:serine/threonine protein kinase